MYAITLAMRKLPYNGIIADPDKIRIQVEPMP